MAMTALPTAAVPIAPANFDDEAASKTVQKRRRGVSFFPKVQIRHGIQRKNFTAEEKKNTWLSKDELQTIRDACTKLAIEFSKRNSGKDGLSKDGEDYQRGFEGKTVGGVIRKTRTRTIARNAVLKELRRQDKRGIFDPDKLAEVYSKHTESARVEAHGVALCDQAEVALLDSPPPPPPPPHPPFSPSVSPRLILRKLKSLSRRRLPGPAPSASHLIAIPAAA